MQIKTFNRAVLILTSTFPNQKIDPEIYFELLKDLQDEPFLKAAEFICKNLTELYPGSNLIAILRDKTGQMAKKPIMLKLPEGQRWEKPPKEFSDLVSGLGNK